MTSPLSAGRYTYWPSEDAAMPWLPKPTDHSSGSWETARDLAGAASMNTALLRVFVAPHVVLSLVRK